MIHRITIDMIFNDIDPMNDIKEEVKRHEHEAITINPGEPNEEHSYWQTQECNHNEAHDGPCTSTGFWQTP